MSNYSKTTDFEAKDSLPTGDSGKIIRGAEFETEFDAISIAIATKADTAGPTFTGTLTFETISDGTIDVTAFVDEDNMASNSATLVPTQQSVKAYVDSQVTAQDLDFQADTGGALSIDLDSETLTFTGGTGIDTSGSGNAVTFVIDSTVATLTGTQTLTNKTLTSPDVNTPDIDGGTIDGTVIGGATAAAGSFTTVSATGNITVDGTVDGRDVATDGTKLDGIEASADVTDATNVTAAGALMDSELTSEASVKALNQGVATTDSPTFAGLTTTANVSFGDNDKAIFGAGSDLQIYHSGATSFITENGTGDLRIGANNLLLRSDDIFVQSEDGTVNSARFNSTTGVTLYRADVVKLATTSTGVDVTGTVTADGLTVQTAQGDITIPSSTSSLNFARAGANYIRATDTAGSFHFVAGANDFATTRLRISANGDVALFEDTGSTPKFFWDSSAERLGLGTTSPANQLDIVSSTNATARIEGGSNGDASLKLTESGISGFELKYDGGDNNLYIGGGTSGSFTTHMTVNRDSGNVGIGTDSPAKELHLASAQPDFRMQDTDGTDQYAEFTESNGSLFIGSRNGASDGQILFRGLGGGASNEYMRLDSSGNVVIGASSVSNPNSYGSVLNIEGYAPALVLSEDTGRDYTIGVNGNKLSIFNETTPVMTLDDSGNVGIGVISPQASLHIVNDASKTQFIASGTVGNDRFLAIDVDTTANPDVAYITVDQADSLAFGEKTNDNDRTILNEHMRIDSSGRVGIGEENPVEELHISGSVPKIQIQDSDGTNQYGQFYHSAGITAIQARNGNTDGIIAFQRYDGTTTDESARFDSSGNLLVGQSSSTTPGIGNTTLGSALLGSGLAAFSRAGGSANATLYVNKNTDNGPIARFSKDGTTVGSIGSYADVRLFIGSGNSNVTFNSSGNNIYPATSSGAANDATLTLGSSTARFNNLYLSGGAYLGGTAAANKLDDYEEGTWTPTIIGSTSGSITGFTLNKAVYVKVGDLVHVGVYLANINMTASTCSGTIQLGGLPFTANSFTGSPSVSFCNMFSFDESDVSISGYVSGNDILLHRGSSTTAITDSDEGTSTAASLMFSLTYEV